MKPITLNSVAAVRAQADCSMVNAKAALLCTDGNIDRAVARLRRTWSAFSVEQEWAVREIIREELVRANIMKQL